MSLDNLIHPIIFDAPKEEKNCYSPSPPSEINLAETPPTETALFKDLIRRPDEEMEAPPLQIEIFDPPVCGHPPATAYPQTSFLVNGDFYLYRRDQTISERPQTAPLKAKQPPAPKPMELAEKLLTMESFVLYEKQLYIYDREKGIYISLDRDDAKRIIVSRLTNDLRIRGSAYQIKEIYEFLRLAPQIKVIDSLPRHLLAFTNGVLDLQTSTFLHRHDPEDFIAWRLEVPFDLENNDCPVFRQVLQQISGGDSTFVARMLDIMAFLMIPCAFTKVIPIFQGVSGTGKSLIARLISSFYDPGIISHIAAYQFRDRFSAATLQGKQLNISMDLPGGKISPEAVAMLKQITGGDEVFIETKGVDGHSAHLDCRFLFGINHPFVPAIRDEAFMDRIVLLPFQYPVPPEVDDPELDQKLLPERTAIFNLVLDAFWLWQKDRYRFFGEEKYGIRAAGFGNSESDPMISTFVRECCHIDSGAQISSDELFVAYKKFLADRGIPCTDNTQQFSRHLNETTPASVIPKKIRVNGKPTNCYTGITLKGGNHAEW